MRRVAAIDCGTNSIRLLIAERDGSSGLRDLERRLRDRTTWPGSRRDG